MSGSQGNGNGERLAHEVESQVRRMERAERERRTLLGQIAHVGVLGLVFVLPVIAGAYLGRWVDGMLEGYSMRWTLSLIVLGVATGMANVYFLVREKP